MTVNTDLPFPDTMVRRMCAAPLVAIADDQALVDGCVARGVQHQHQREAYLKRLALFLWDNYLRCVLPAIALSISRSLTCLVRVRAAACIVAGSPRPRTL